MSQRGWVIFDFDGVIVDSFNAAYKLTEHLLKTKNEAAYRALFRDSIFTVLKKKLSPARIAGLFRRFNSTLHSQPIVLGMADLITAVGHQYNLAVVSSSSTAAIKRFLADHGIVNYFTDILGYNMEISKSLKIQQLMENYRFSTKECIMVTDTIGDVKEASAVGVPSIAVSWGYQSEEDFKTISTFAVVHTPLELKQVIDSYFK